MSLAMALVLQAAVPDAPAPPNLAAIQFDLARFRPFDLDSAMPGRACDRSDPSTIVVCGRRTGGAYPLDRMALEFEPERIVAETRLIGNLNGYIGVEAVQFPGGQVSNRVMIGIRTPF